MKQTKRLLSALLTLCMLIGLLPAAAAEAETRTANSIQTELAEVDRQLAARKAGGGEDYSRSPGLPTGFDKEGEKDGFVIHFGDDIGNRYSYNGPDLEGKGKAATISVSGSGTDGAFNHPGELFNMMVHWPKSLMQSTGQTEMLSESAVPSNYGRARLCLSETDQFRNSNIGYVPFALSVYVPANTIKTVRFEFDSGATRGSKGAAGYYIELFHWGSAYDESKVNAIKFMTGDTDTATSSSYVMAPNGMASGKRAYWDTRSGGYYKTSADVTFSNTDSEGRWVTEYFGYYAGVGRSSSALSSYHHKMGSAVNIYQQVLSTQPIAAPAARVAPKIGIAKTYDTIEEAVEAFNNAGESTLTLLKDVHSQYGWTTLTGKGSIDLNGHTWTEGRFTIGNGAEVTFENGTLVGSEGTDLFRVDAGGRLLLWDKTGQSDSGVTVKTETDPAKLGSGRAAISVQGFLRVREGTRIETNAPAAIAVSGARASVDLQESIAFSGDRTADIRLSQGARLSVTENKSGSGIYRLAVDESPTAEKTVAISSETWKNRVPGDWFALTGKPGCQMDVEENRAVIRLNRITPDPQSGSLPGGETVLSTTPEGKLPSLPAAIKAGSNLEGWYTQATGGTKVDASTVFSADGTIYARWQNPPHTVTFDAKGGTSTTGSKQAAYGGTYGTLPTPTRTGYDFTGWYTQATGGSEVNANTEVTENADHTLYAHWTAKRIDVTYDGNYTGAATQTRTVTFGGTYGALPTPTRTGYDFTGWYTDKTGGTKVESGTKVEKDSKHTLYARWNAKTVTVTFDANGGTSAPDSIQVTYGGRYSGLPAPTRTGYTFTGWFASATGGTKVESASTVTRAAAHTLYAQWARVTFTVTFDGNVPAGAGDTVTGLPGIQTVAQGAAVSRPTAPKREKYNFVGWYKEAECKNAWNFSTDTVTGAVTLYAKWEPKTYTIRFYAGTGSFSTESGQSQYWRYLTGKTDLSDYTQMTETPTRDGYTFAGWVQLSEGELSGELTGNVTLYPTWKPEMVTFTLDVNGGTAWGEGEGTVELPKAGKFGSNLPAPAWSDNTKSFEGWYTAETGGTRITSETRVADVAGTSESITLYAHWLERHVHIIDGKEVEFEPWDGLGSSITSDKCYYLTKDVNKGTTPLTIYSGAKMHLCLNGHTLSSAVSSNSTSTYNGVVEIQSGEFHLYDCAPASSGKIQNTCTSIGWGAGVAVTDSNCTFYMHSGRISECKNMGVSIGSGGKMTMAGGEISGNGRCGIWINGAGTVVSLANGRIANNTGGGSNHGAGIYYSASTDNAGTLTLDNMEIVNNKSFDDSNSDTYGAGLFVQAGTQVTLKNKVVIWGNKDKNGKDNNVRFWNYNNNHFSINGILTEGSYIGMSMNKSPGTIVAVAEDETKATANKDFFASDKDGYKIETDGVNINCLIGEGQNPTPPTIEEELGTDPVPDIPAEGQPEPEPPDGSGGEDDNSKHEHMPCGETSCGHGHSAIEYTALEGDTLSTGSAYLTEDVDSLTVSGDANLCLNGQKVTALSITGGTLTLCDCQGGGSVGTITFSGSGKLALPIPKPADGSKIEISVSGSSPVTIADGWNDSMGDPNDYFTPPEGKVLKVDESGNLTVAEPVTSPDAVTVTVIKPDGTSEELTVKSDGTIDTSQLPKNSGPAPVGKIPDGWTTDPDGGSTKIDESTKFTKDTTVYPHWKDCGHEGGENAGWKVTETVPATCTRDGYTVSTCQTCQATKTETLKASGHEFETTWQSDENGHWHACKNCGEKSDFTAHTLVKSGDTARKCTEEVSQAYTCSVCSKTATVTLPALGHNFSGDWAHDDAQHWRKCTRCNAEDTVKENHAWTATVSREPTAEADGEESLTCVCGATATRAIPKLETVTAGEGTPEPTYNATFVYGPHQQPTEVTGKLFKEAVTVPDPGTRIGFTFAQWNWFALSTLDSGIAQPGSYTMPASNVVFTALWNRDERTTLNPGDKLILDDGTVIENQGGTVTIDRDGDGATDTTIRPGGGEDSVDVVHKDGGKDVIELPDGSTVQSTYPDPDPENPGGDAPKKDGPTITVGGGGGEVDMDGNVTLHPGSTIEEKDGGKVTIDEGTAVVEPDGTTTFPEGGKVTVTDPDDTKTEVTVPAPVEGEEPPEISTQRYTVTFDMGGHGTQLDPLENVVSGSKLTKPEDPSAEGYTFGGWYLRDSDPDPGKPKEKAWDFDADIVTGDITLHARWTGVNKSTEPTISRQPSGISGLTEGEIPADAKLTVEVDDPPEGGGTITYQWYEKGENGEFQPIEGATSPEYTIPADTGAGTHEYYCEVTNTEEGKEPTSVETDKVTVTVDAAHEHDWGDWHITKEPTLTETGTAERVCNTNSSHTESKELPVLLDTSVWTPGDRVEPGEDTPGSQKYTSEYGTVTIEIPPTGPKPPAGGKVPLDPGEKVEVDTDGDGNTDIVVERGEDGTVTIDKDNDGTPDVTIETPKDGEVIVDTETGETEVPGGSTVQPGSGDGPEIKLPDGGKVDPENGGVTPDEGGSVVIPGGSGKPDITVTPPATGDREVNVDEQGKVTVPDNSTVQPSGGDGPEIKLPDGGKVDPEDGGVIPGESGSVVVPGGGDDITITPPADGGDDDRKVTVDEAGKVEVPGGSTVQPGGGDGPEIKLPDGGKVDPEDGGVIPGEGGSMVVPGGGDDITITPPADGGDDDRKVTVDEDDKVKVPGGSTVQPGGGDGPEIKLPEGGKVDPNTGSTTAPEVEVDGTTVTPPTDKTDVTTDKDGNTPVGPGSSVSKGDGDDEVSVKVIEGEGVVDRDGNVTFPNGDGKVEISKGSNTSELEVPKGGSVPTDSGKLHDVSGEVKNPGGTAVSGAGVKLWQGVKRLAETTTDVNGKFVFHNIPNGVYNIVATADEKTKTQMVILNRDIETLTLTMPSDNVNSVLEVVGPPPAASGEKPAAAVEKTVVGGLDEEAEAQKEENATVTVTMKVEKKEEDDAAGAEQIRNESASETKKLEFLDITVNKTVTRDAADSTERLSMTSVVIEIVVPFNFAGKTKDSIAVYRFHEDKAEALQKGEDRQDGVFMLDMENGLIHIFANRFSTYAIGYEEEGSTPVHKHSWAEAWTSNSTHHWHECTKEGCTITDNAQKDGYGAHVYDDAQDATCNQCDYQRSVTPPPSGGGSPATYPPDVEKPDHGKISVSPKRPERGDKVTVTLTPDEGYQTDGITVTDRNGRPVAVTDHGDGTYTFIQPSGKVTVSASFRPDGSFGSCPRNRSCPIARFPDASPTAWYHDGVHYCLEHGLMEGYDTGLLGPDDHLSRAQMVQILYNQAGRPDVTGVSSFEDVAPGAWYANAVAWAQQSGIVSGYDSRHFYPDGRITREQLATILWRHAGSPAATGLALDFTDADNVSGYAADALRWAVDRKIIYGKGSGILDPTGLTTRAEAASMLMRYATK